MRKIIKYIVEWFVWIASPKVLEAINDGATYEQVEAVVDEQSAALVGGRKS